MKRWEYKRLWISSDFDNDLKKLGEEGWELVAITQDSIFWLKREIH